jgi:molybdenum cofactor cytidylyltransferase
MTNQINTDKAAGIVLAAGASVRMGRTKQLLPIQGGTLLGRVLNEALASDLDHIVLVLGHQANEIRSALGRFIKHPKLVVIENRHYTQGISSSIIAGLREVEESYWHVMIILGDMPHIDSRLINQLLRQYLDSRLSIGAVRVGTKRSHPVIFNKQIYDEIHRLSGDVGGKELFSSHAGQVCLVEPEHEYDDRDIDSPEDYADLLKE